MRIEVALGDRPLLEFLERLGSPVLFYDNKCVVCYDLARLVYRLSRGRVSVIGVFSDEAWWLKRVVSDPLLLHATPWLYDPRGRRFLGGRRLVVRVLWYIVRSLLARGRPRDTVFVGERPDTCSSLHPCTLVGGLLHVLRQSYEIVLRPR